MQTGFDTGFSGWRFYDRHHACLLTMKCTGYSLHSCQENELEGDIVTSRQHCEPVRRSTLRIRIIQNARRATLGQAMTILACSVLMLATTTVSAETIKQLVDVNPRPSEISNDSFQSNGQAALFQASTSWLRITNNAIRPIRLNAPTGTVTALHATRNFFYYISRDELAGTATVWRVNARGSNRKIIGKMSGVHRFSEPLVHAETGNVYLGDYRETSAIRVFGCGDLIRPAERFVPSHSCGVNAAKTAWTIWSSRDLTFS